MLGVARLFSRSIRPPDEIIPNPNDPADVPPATVGPPAAVPGDPHGVVFAPGGPAGAPPITVSQPMPWSGWPAEWSTPSWNARVQTLSDIAWACVDLNANVLSTMPPYLIGAAPSLDAGWVRNPNPDVYSCWEEFAKQLFWDYQLGEAFVIADARYATGFPARFHVVPPWLVEVDMADGRRLYTIGQLDVTQDMLHIRYQSTVDDAHGHGPLEAAEGRVIAADVLNRYATTLAANGGIPSSVLENPDELSADQALALKQQWVEARMSSIGEPAVLSGGVTWKPTQLNPAEMALLDLSRFNESRICTMLGVPPHMMGLPSGGDPMTYSNVTSIFNFHWRASLRPKAQSVMSALSEWLLPAGTAVEVNRDAYIEPEPLQRAQTAEILNRIRDPQGNPALTVPEIRAAERLDDTTPDVAQGVLR